MKRILFSLLMLCCCFLQGQASTLTKTDSLQKALQTLPHDSTRLKLLQNILRIEQANPKCIHLSEQLLKEATMQNNPNYAGVAIYFQIIYYYNQNELDSVSKRLVAMEPYARKAKLWNYFFDGMRCQIDLFSYREQYELAVNKSLEMLDKSKAMGNIRGQIGANQCLSTAYLGTRRMKEAKHTLKEAHKLLPQLGNVIVHNSVLTQLITLSREMHDYTDMAKYLKEQKKLMTDYITSSPEMREATNDSFIFNEIYYAYYHIDMKQAESALKHLNTVDSYLSDNTYFMYKVLYDDVYADYYLLNKEYDKALTHLDSTIIKLKDSFKSDYIHQLEKKADILAEAGRKQEALPIYQKVFHAKDSLDKDISDKQMQLIQKDYHVDKLLLEKELLRNKIQLTVLSVSLLAISALLFFTYRIFHIRKALKRSEQQTREATQVAEAANEMKNHFLSNMSYNIRIPLNGVVGFSQLITMDADMNEETRKEYSAIIQKNSEELMRLVNDVLDLSRLEADMMKFQMQENDIISLCNDVLYMAREKNGAEINIEFDQQIGTLQTIMVDTARLMQAVLSALVCPQPCDKKRTIRFTLALNNTEPHAIRICINNSPLADPEFLSQEVSIRHDINRLLLKHFGGTYTVAPDAPEGPTIVFTYPLSVSE